MSESFQKIVYKRGSYLQKIYWTVAGYFKRISDLLCIYKYDVVYVFLWVAPFAPPVFEYLTRQLARRLIYDIDDLVFLKPPSSANPLVHYLRSSRNHISLMKTADHVITCTPYLDSFVRKFNSRTTDISSTINTSAYQPKNNYAVKGQLVIGWSGSHSTSKYLHLLDEVFQELAKKSNFKLVVMGDANFKVPGVEVEAVEWDERHEIEVIRSFDIGVYPLPNEEWVYGKSGLKALQYMALGVPTIATAIGTIFRIIKQEENGFLVSTREEWKHTLLRLMYSQSLREQIGTTAVFSVRERFSVDANKASYISILNKLTDS